MLISRERILSLLQKGQDFRTLADCAAVGSKQSGGDTKAKDVQKLHCKTSMGSFCKQSSTVTQLSKWTDPPFLRKKRSN